MAVGTLSGGNLQKVVVARELSHEAPVLIAEQPTRGLDVGATEYIHERLVGERDNGRAVLLVSAELLRLVQPGGDLVVEALGPTQMRGRAAAIEVFAVERKPLGSRLRTDRRTARFPGP